MFWLVMDEIEKTHTGNDNDDKIIYVRISTHISYKVSCRIYKDLIFMTSYSQVRKT